MPNRYCSGKKKNARFDFNFNRNTYNNNSYIIMAEIILFFTTRIGSYIIIGVVSLLLVLYSHHKGYIAGQDEAQAQQLKEYTEKLNKALEEYRTKQIDEINRAKEVASKEKEIADHYINRSEELQKLINKSNTINNCGMSKSEFMQYKKILESK